MDLSDVQAQYRDPLMGWTGTCRPGASNRLFFATQEEALMYLTQRNIAYVIENTHDEKITPKQYGTHFGPKRIL